MIIKTCLANQNAGDIQLNHALAMQFTGRKPTFVNNAYSGGDINYILAGSLLHWADHNSIVWGAGYLKKDSKVKVAPSEIHAVRGKLTRASLLAQGIDCPEVYGDPGLILPLIYKAPLIPKRYKIGVIPHYIDAHVYSSLVNVRSQAGVVYIDILSAIHTIISKMLECEVIFSSSLHGLIFADAYGIPNVWARFSNKILGGNFKYLDYFSSVGRTETEPVIIDENTDILEASKLASSGKIDFDIMEFYKTCPLLIN